MVNDHPISAHLNSVDPLCHEAIEFLLNYKEEDDLVDYKLTLDPDSEKEWIEIVKDITAFSNTFGGYLVFGVRNSDKSVIGLSDAHAMNLSDINNIHQKVNRFVEPQIGRLRSKEYTSNGKKVVVMYIPAGMGVTYVIGKDASYIQLSKKPKPLLHKGTFYVRRSASNHLADARDFDNLVERRIDQYKEVLLSRISRVVDAPRESEVFILSKDENDPDSKRFVIESGPDAIAVKGMSFSIAPEEDEEKIAAWVVISSGNPQIVPPVSELWEWYGNRLSLGITEKQRLAIAQFCMWSEVPMFYWLRGLRAQDIQSMVLDTINHRKPGTLLKPMMVTASFLGKSFYKRAISALGEHKSKLPAAMQKYPERGPKNTYGDLNPRAGQSRADVIATLNTELNDIVNSVDVGSNKHQPSALHRTKALKLDCYLYAQDDKYA